MQHLWKLLNSPLVLIVAACLGLSLVAEHLFSSRYVKLSIDPDRGATTLKETQRVRNTLEKIAISGVTVSTAELTDRAKIIGTMHNNADVPVGIKQAQVTLVGTNGILLDVADAYLGGIPFYPGKSENFAIDTGMCRSDFDNLQPKIEVQITDILIIDN
jgi:hypothetical protein